MLQATFRSIQTWPGTAKPAHRRVRARFKTGYADTLSLLESELRKLSARSVVIQVYLAAEQIRNDGWPRSSSRPSAPGVVVSFDTTKGPLSFPCDTFDDWQDNLLAIAKSLEALRMVDRYGVTQSHEQYRGFAQLPPPAANGNAGLTRQEAANLLSGITGIAASAMLESRGWSEAAYKRAAASTHPDRDGGSHEQFVAVQQAWDVLRKAEA